jgi:hypothetical protein
LLLLLVFQRCCCGWCTGQTQAADQGLRLTLLHLLATQLLLVWQPGISPHYLSLPAHP